MIDADPDGTDAALDLDADYRALFDLIDDGFAVIELIADADGRTVDVLHLDANPAYERHTGIHGIVGKCASEVGLERGPWYDAYTEVARTGTAVRIEAHIAAIDRWLSAHVSRIGGDGSRTLAVVFHDITDRKHAEAALRESEEKYRALFDRMEEGFCGLEILRDQAGRGIDVRIVELNAALERQTGLARDKLIGKRMSEVFPPEDTQRWLPVWIRIADTGEPETIVEYAAIADRWFETSGYRQATDRVAYFFRDVTNRKKAEHVLRDSEGAADVPAQAERCATPAGGRRRDQERGGPAGRPASRRRALRLCRVSRA